METYPVYIIANFINRKEVRNILRKCDIDYQEEWHLFKSIFTLKMDVSVKQIETWLEGLSQNPNLKITRTGP